MTPDKCLSPAGLLVAITLFAAAQTGAAAAEMRVSDAEQFQRAVKVAQAGDTITMANGTWTDVVLVFDARGEQDDPVTVAAETPGQVIITGSSRMGVRGQWLVVSGLVFRDGCPPPGQTPEWLAERGITQYPAVMSVSGSNLRITECAFIDYNPPVEPELQWRHLYYWVAMGGRDVRLDHCYFRGQTHQAPTVNVGVSERPVRAHIDTNHFAGRPPLGRNGAETIRIGYSGTAHHNAHCIVERNLFEDCDGESEIISNKSCENTYRYNTFRRNSGHLTLRHGDRCTVEGNYILGEGKARSAGIRVIGEEHRVINNYISNTAGFGISLYAGWVVGKIGYVQVRRLLSAFNTILNTAGPCLELGGHGWDAEEHGAVMPEDCSFAYNAMSRPGETVIESRGDCTDLRWHNNMVHGSDPGIQDEGVQLVDDLRMIADPSGIFRPALDSSLRNAALPIPADFLGTAMLWNLADVVLDIQGKQRGERSDIGCFQVSDEPLTHVPLTAANVGPTWMRP
jgi:poly(beta-D-mannuronate) lyase